MKTFKDILIESKKTYPFKIGVAGELPEGFEDRLEVALKKYEIARITNGKKTPIQERPLDFPQLQNTEVTYWDVELNYPTTPQVLGEYLTQICTVPRNSIIVRNPNDPLECYQEKESNEPYESILATHEMGGESAQHSVAGNRIMELLRELEIARKERDHEPIASIAKGDQKDMGDEEYTKSPIGSH